jgi:hypothetical protein
MLKHGKQAVPFSSQKERVYPGSDHVLELGA